jgi:hypothetical protein
MTMSQGPACHDVQTADRQVDIGAEDHLRQLGDQAGRGRLSGETRQFQQCGGLPFSDLGRLLVRRRHPGMPPPSSRAR